MIDRKFIFFNTKEAFEEKLNAGEISQNSIVFIKGKTDADRAIWTHGVYFSSGESVGQTVDHAKGFFDFETELIAAYPVPVVGDWAIVSVRDNDNSKESVWYIYRCITPGTWSRTALRYEHESVDLSRYVKGTELSVYLNNYVNLYLFYNAIHGLENTLNNILEREHPKHIFLTQAEYNALTEYEEGAIYFILGSENPDVQNTWKFGDVFPVVLT